MSCQQGPVTGVSEAEGLRKPSVSPILRLALLTPDIVEGILAGTAFIKAGLLKAMSSTISIHHSTSTLTRKIQCAQTARITSGG